MTVHKYSAVDDNWIDEENATTNHGNDTALWVRWDSTGKAPAGYDRKTVMRFQNTGAANGHCQDAWLEIRVLELWGSPSGMHFGARSLQYYPSAYSDTDWQELLSSWNHRGYIDGSWKAWNTRGGSLPAGAYYYPASAGPLTIRIGYADGKNTIKRLVDDYRDSNSGDTHLWFENESTGETDFGMSIAAHDHATVAYRPVLVICEAGTDRRRHC